MRNTEIIQITGMNDPAAAANASKDIFPYLALAVENTIGYGKTVAGESLIVVKTDEENKVLLMVQKAEGKIYSAAYKKGETYGKVTALDRDVNIAIMGLLSQSGSGIRFDVDAEEKEAELKKATDLLRTYLPSVNLPQLTQLKPVYISDGTYGDAMVLTYGDLSVFTGQSSTEKPRRTGKIDRKFLLNPSRILSEEEQKMVPVMGDKYVIPEKLEAVAKVMAANPKMRKLIISGPAGTGKTEGTLALASAFGSPYTTLVCDPDMDSNKLYASFVPNTGTGDDDLVSAGLDVSAAEEEEEVSPETKVAVEGFFERLTNQKKKWTEIMASILVTQTQEKGGAFKLVESPLVQALRYGWVCEIQEPTIIRSSGVLAELNDVMKTGIVRVPVTGEVFRAHPDAVIVFTTNAKYEGCRLMNESVWDRGQAFVHMDELSTSELANYAFAATGYNIASLTTMAKTIVSVSQAIKDSGDTSGVIGLRSLIDWAEYAKILDDERLACELTVIGRASQIDEKTRELAQVVVEQIYGKEGE